MVLEITKTKAIGLLIGIGLCNVQCASAEETGRVGLVNPGSILISTNEDPIEHLPPQHATGKGETDPYQGSLQTILSPNPSSGLLTDDSPPPGYWPQWLLVKGQLTNITMWHPSVSSNNSNALAANALNAGAENKETTDMTLFLGLKLAEHTSLFFNPEIDEGFGISNTVGIAGYPSGGAYKVGSKEPYGRIPRLFVRQIIDLGGELETTEEGANQFASNQTHDNVTITAGKFAVVDLFDTNRYAHDPRADFLNWSTIESGAFDYAADSWGYTYGLSAEWRQASWTLRTGLFDLSSQPNSEILDSTFKQFEWVGELEKRYAIGQRIGAVRLLGYVNKGNMGSYADATQLAINLSTTQACPLADLTPSTACVRHYSAQSGGGLNLEQEISRTVGLFARLSANQGKKETFEFTDINQSLALGVLIQGSAWGRSQDSLGAAEVINAISSDARRYFSAGGQGLLIGDGWMNYAQERITETFYRFQLNSRSHVSLNLQYILNPAYNQDRGPVTTVGARFHIDF